MRINIYCKDNKYIKEESIYIKRFEENNETFIIIDEYEKERMYDKKKYSIISDITVVRWE